VWCGGVCCYTSGVGCMGCGLCAFIKMVVSSFELLIYGCDGCGVVECAVMCLEWAAGVGIVCIKMVVHYHLLNC